MAADEWSEKMSARKYPPEMRRIETMLRTSAISRTGFLGSDTRSLEEILAADRSAAAAAGRSLGEIAQRMREITEKAKEGMETDVRIGEHLTAAAAHTRGMLPCPWPHKGVYGKTVTTVTRSDTGQTVRWSDLNIHMIEAHGFFEGCGADFRLNPRELISIIFHQDAPPSSTDE